MGTTAGDAPCDTGSPRRRDADRTRRALLRSATRRFARDGYAATTVRDVAADAGVNVALISRYFDSKAGLFEACLESATSTMTRPPRTVSTLADAVDRLVAAVAGPGADASAPEEIALFLRSSGDEHAENIRVGALRSSGERLATLAGWKPGGSDDVLLGAQLVVAAAAGIRLLRAAGGPEPLMSAGAEDLAAPMRALVSALVGPVGPPEPGVD